MNLTGKAAHASAWAGITSCFLTAVYRAVQCPSWGYPTERAYYRDASSVDPLLAIRVPFLAIQAEDDPVCNHGKLIIPKENL